jgi:hypothetical protein
VGAAGRQEASSCRYRGRKTMGFRCWIGSEMDATEEETGLNMGGGGLGSAGRYGCVGRVRCVPRLARLAGPTPSTLPSSLPPSLASFLQPRNRRACWRELGPLVATWTGRPPLLSGRNIGVLAEDALSQSENAPSFRRRSDLICNTQSRSQIAACICTPDLAWQLRHSLRLQR